LIVSNSGGKDTAFFTINVYSTPLAPTAGTNATYCQGHIISPLTATGTSIQWFSDPDVHKFLSRKRITLKEERQWIRSLKKKKNKERHFAIDTFDHVHIGSIGLILNHQDRRGRLGIVIGDKNYWNKGYGTDAIACILKYGFTKLHLHRIDLTVFDYNKRAIRVYKKLGFKVEGAQRESIFYKKRFYNTLLMGILYKEWARKNKLKTK
jgi:RimJ/RimL family protein N-acetyltransferase